MSKTLLAAALGAVTFAGAAAPAVASDRYAPSAPILVGDYDTVGVAGLGAFQDVDVIAFSTRIPEDQSEIARMKRFDIDLRILER